MTNMIIQPLTVMDFDAINPIEQRAYPVPWSPEIVHSALSADYLRVKLVVAKNIIGYAFVSVVIDEAHLLNITIDPSYQRQGYGRVLLSHLVHSLIPKSVHTLFLEVRESNQGAKTLYTNMGFNEIGVRKNYYPKIQGREHAIIMAYAFF